MYDNLKKLTSKHIKDFSSIELKELQSLLNKWGHSLAVDGIYGTNTEKAFTDFKKQNNLTEPYLFGQTTLQFLLKNPFKRQINEAGISLIKEFESFRSNAYLCPANVWTIGYGSTFYNDGKKVVKGNKITEKEADKLLRITVESFADQVAKLIKVPVTSNQFSALVSLTYNIGIGAFARSTLLSMLNNRKSKEDVAIQFLRWNKANGKILTGLTRRREKEMQLFLR
ncbi:glycoside hydrolase family protein [Geminocystis sp. GBBB08]|uniref:glycoside hydrolase family protein n=1 Tax=Geminocystis sp. GBBB08 TaxID=2604140 RepID=UPI0027E36C6F|nr:glycoside hydrolase family protein [Geminocystis sp. GBBB08]MBL1208830.1 glycoside hydrolase family protein [Geminocystis sp. GBBB08]